MNVYIPPRQSATRAAEGFARRFFTVKDVLKMQRRGIIGPEEKFELVEGEIVPMQSKVHLHELIKSDLLIKIGRALPDDLWLGVESSMYLSDRTVLEPDLVVYRRGQKLESVKGPDIILAKEVAVSTLAYDRGLKASLYAHYGVRELWVIDAKKRCTFVHTPPAIEGWGSIAKLTSDAMLHCAALPGFAAQLSQM